MASLTITIDTPPLPPGMLQKGAPEGITVSHQPMPFMRGMSAQTSAVSQDFDITVSFETSIGTAVVGAWICRVFNSSRFHLNPRINGKPLPPGEEDALKVIAAAIEPPPGEKPKKRSKKKGESAPVS